MPGTPKTLLLDRFFIKLGYANRQVLAEHLKHAAAKDHNLVLDLLEQKGILKSSARKKISSLEEITYKNLSKTLTQKSAASLGIDAIQEDPLLFGQATTIQLLNKGISASLDGFSRAAHSDAAHFSLALGVGMITAINVATVITCGSWLTTTLILGTGVSYLAKKTASHLPPDYSRLTSFANFIGRLLPLFLALDGIALGWQAHLVNLNFMSLISSTGSLGISNLVFGSAFAIKHNLRQNLIEQEKSYGGHVDPGKIRGAKSARTMMCAATGSVIADLNYLAIRSILMAGAAWFLVANAANPLLYAALATPLLGIGGTALIRSSSKAQKGFKYLFKDTEKLNDAKIFLPYASLKWGAQLAAFSCLIPACGIGAAAMLASPYLIFVAAAPLFIYLTAWGSLTNLLVSESHGIFHSVNTNLGFIQALKASFIDVMGSFEARGLTDDKEILVFNPHTGPNEHTYGLLFSVLLARKPNLKFFCMFDRVLTADNGKFVKQFTQEKDFIAWVKKLQETIHAKLTDGIKEEADLENKYARLSRNLNALADYFQKDLRKEISETVSKNEAWFDYKSFVEEYLRAAFEELSNREEEFRSLAEKLDKKVQEKTATLEDFKRGYQRLTGCYDPDLVEIVSVARKEVGGEDVKFRKAENIAAIPFFRGVSVYKIGRREEENKTNTGNYPTMEWTYGKWTRVANPNYDPLASGPEKSSKYILVESEAVLTDVQKKHRAALSTHPDYQCADNTPRTGEGSPYSDLQEKNLELKIESNGRKIHVKRYYYFKDNNYALPPIQELIKRDGTRIDKVAFDRNNPRGEFVTSWHAPDKRIEKEISPAAFVVPAFDFTLMMDKNDIELSSYTTLPALIEREKKHPFAILTFKEEMEKKISLPDPAPEKPISKIEIVDGSVEILHPSAPSRNIVYQLDRSQIHLGRKTNDDVDWLKLEKTVIDINDKKEVSGFKLIYRQSKDISLGNIAELQTLMQSNGSLGVEDEIVLTIENDGNNQYGECREITSAKTIIDGLEKTVTLSQSTADELQKKIKAAGFVNTSEITVKCSKNDKGEFVFRVVNENHQISVTLPPSVYPKYAAALDLEEGRNVLAINNFTKGPILEGDASWFKISYLDGTFSFVRCEDGIRPMLYDRSGEDYFQFERENGKIEIKNLSIPRGLPIELSPGWTEGLRNGDRVTNIETTGSGKVLGLVKGTDRQGKKVEKIIEFENYKLWDRSKHIKATIEISPKDNGRLDSIERRMDAKGLSDDSSAYIYTLTREAEKKIEEKNLDLGDPKLRVKITADKNVEIFKDDALLLTLKGENFIDNWEKTLLSNKKGRVASLEDVYQGENARYAPKIDYYNGRLRLVAHKVDHREIEMPEELANLNLKTFTIAPAASHASITVNRRAAMEDFGNDKRIWEKLKETGFVAGTISKQDIIHLFGYQKYSGVWKALCESEVIDKKGFILKNKNDLADLIETLSFKDKEKGQLAEIFKTALEKDNLIVYKKASSAKDLQKELGLSDSSKAEEIFTALEKSVRKIPLTLDKPLPFSQEEIDQKIDFSISVFSEGLIKSTIGPQTRYGNKGEYSGFYPRDPYFYGMSIFTSPEDRDAWGEYFAINRAKSLRAFRGIESGRTHVMPYEILFDPSSADLMETNSLYARKLSNYGHYYWGPGVSEDTQQEMVLWIRGARMHVVKEAVGILTAEKDWGKYNVQNSTRYNYSEALFVTPFQLMMKDSVRKLNPLSSRQPWTTWAEISEIAAGRTWYKLPLAKLTELSSIPAYLGSFGHILFFPVDLNLFLISWGARTCVSSANYLFQMLSLGYKDAKGFKTGFYDNPGMELTFLNGYLKAALDQFAYRYQYGIFMLTGGGAGSKVPDSTKHWLYGYMGANALGIGMFALSMCTGGWGTFALMFALGANVVFGAYTIALIRKALSIAKTAELDGEISDKGKAQKNFKESLQFIESSDLDNLRKEISDIHKTISGNFSLESLKEQESAALEKIRAAAENLNGKKGYQIPLAIGRKLAKLLPFGSSLSDKLPRQITGKKGLTERIDEQLGITALTAGSKKMGVRIEELENSLKKNKAKIDSLKEQKGQEDNRIAPKLAPRLAIKRLIYSTGMDNRIQDIISQKSLPIDLNELKQTVSLAIKEGEKQKEAKKELRQARALLVEERIDAALSFRDRIMPAIKAEKDLGYNKLFAYRTEIKAVLEKMDATTKDGKEFRFGFENPLRNVINDILEVYSSLEMLVCAKAMQNLRQGKDGLEDRAALLRLIKTSKEFIVIDTAVKTYRRMMLKTYNKDVSIK